MLALSLDMGGTHTGCAVVRDRTCCDISAGFLLGVHLLVDFRSRLFKCGNIGCQTRRDG
jgi:hypothetical protein